MSEHFLVKTNILMFRFIQKLLCSKQEYRHLVMVMAEWRRKKIVSVETMSCCAKGGANFC